MPSFKNRRGSQIVEATMVLPLTVLILAALICQLMTFHGNLARQIEVHKAAREELYHTKEVTILRMKDSLKQAAGEVALP